MSYDPYANPDYYRDVFKGNIVPDEFLDRVLLQASRHIDTLTYNRIVRTGIERLTPFQREMVREVCCQQAEFEYQNQDIFDTVLSGYSINGVAMQFGESWNVAIHKGIPMRRDVYEQLVQTGLCCRLAR